MNETRHALILHLASGGEPLVYALSDRAAKSLAPRLPVLMASAGVDTPELADGTNAAINFGHVASAHLDTLPAHVRVYGSPDRGVGFGK
ncbi:hypothetical protein V5P93_000168 [Actinokineospora auranticolor]|uniref:Uncharacterized protein n=1 Tax=Actinokineospora auranticolor TaxID=155976 RepID=A0A2S6GL28_9PSEU|nr:hypothetical protein [Actinokineospora auranticolor]PPK65938.1 hypothetical protein CLV40_112206 [Actinokineospora auranticolor]